MNPEAFNTNLSKYPFEGEKPKTVRELLHQENQINANPPFQRGLVWDIPMKRALIFSLVTGLHISVTFYRAAKEGDVNYKKLNVLDGKQKLIGSIFGFFHDGFTYSFIIDGQKQDLLFSQIENLAQNSNPTCITFLEKFYDATIHVNYYGYMETDKAVEVFEMINQAKKLSIAESICARNYVVRSLCSYLFSYIRSELKDYIPNNLLSSEKREGEYMMLQMLFLNFGGSLDGNFEAKTAGGKELQPYANRLEKFLRNTHGWDSNTIINDNEFQRIDLEYLDESIKNASKYLKMVLDQNQHSGFLQIEKVDILDMLLYFIQMTRDLIFTAKFCEDNSLKMYELIKEYIKWKANADLKGLEIYYKPNKKKNTPENISYDVKAHTTAGYLINIRYQKLKLLFENSGLDLGRKNQRASKEQKKIAQLNSTGIDPLSGRNIHRQDIHWAHVQSAKTISNVEIVPAYPMANIIASSNDVPIEFKKPKAVDVETFIQ